MSAQINMADTRLEEAEIQAAVEVLRSGNLRQGPQVAAFEKRFAEFVGAKYAVASSSGTSALHLAYLSFLEPGDEVLVPSFTFFATASAVALAGGKPVFCDIHPRTFTLDAAEVEKKITGRTRALGPVHLFGNACAVSGLMALAEKHKLRIVWDAAQAHGTRYAGQDIGSYPDFVCYSFYPTKNLFVGEGGMTVTNDAAAAEKMKLYRSHGQAQKYFHTLIGYNYRMTDVEGAIGLKQMDRLPRMLETRRRNAAILTEALSAIQGFAPQQVEDNSVHSYHQYCFLMDQDRLGIDRETFRNRLHQKGVMTAIHYPLGLHQQPVFQAGVGAVSLPVTEAITSSIMAIPVHHGLTKAEVEYIAATIKEAAKP
jgi:perosamine synthetase